MVNKEVRKQEKTFIKIPRRYKNIKIDTWYQGGI